MVRKFWWGIIWLKIWKLKVSSKVRDFTWRACWDIIPHGANLFKKGISDFVRCKRCGCVETLSHLLRDCPWTKEFWKLSDFIFSDPMSDSFRDMLDWVWHHMESGRWRSL